MDDGGEEEHQQQEGRELERHWDPINIQLTTDISRDEVNKIICSKISVPIEGQANPELRVPDAHEEEENPAHEEPNEGQEDEDELERQQLMPMRKPMTIDKWMRIPGKGKETIHQMGSTLRGRVKRQKASMPTT